MKAIVTYQGEHVDVKLTSGSNGNVIQTMPAGTRGMWEDVGVEVPADFQQAEYLAVRIFLQENTPTVAYSV